MASFPPATLAQKVARSGAPGKRAPIPTMATAWSARSGAPMAVRITAG